jgi:hypothetical protein
VRALGGRGRGQRRVDAVLRLLVGARELEGQQRRAAVLGDLAGVALRERRADVGHVRHGLQPPREVGGRRRHPGAAGARPGPGLDEHLLVDVVREAGGRDRAICDLGLAVAHGLVGQLLRADRAADERRDDHEGQPAEDRLLAVPRAPEPGARGEVAFLHHVPSCEVGGCCEVGGAR